MSVYRPFLSSWSWYGLHDAHFRRFCRFCRFCQAGIVVLSQAASPLGLQFPFFARPLSGFWSGLEAAHLRQLRHFRGWSVAYSHPVVLLRLHFLLLRYHAPALSRIFRAIERRHVRRVSIEIRARDPKLLLMRIDPLPQLLGRCVPLRAVFAFDAHEIGRKPVAVPAAAAPAMK